MKHPLSALLLAVAMVTVADAQIAEAPEVIVVTGRLPGPPLWRVSKGDHVLWIFAVLDTVPNEMEWAPTRVAAVIDKTEAYLPLPNVTFAFSPLLLLNPVNVVRGLRLQKKLTHNPDGRRLQDVLPPPLAQRFAVLQAMHFPEDEAFDDLRPAEAANRMTTLVLRQAGLNESPTVVTRPLERLLLGRHDLHRFNTQFDYELSGGYGSLAERAEAMVDSISPLREQECFAWKLHKLEVDVDAMKQRANAWAQGDVAAFRELPRKNTVDDPCFTLMMGTSEENTLLDAVTRSQQQWISLAEEAMARYAVTLAVLDIDDVLSENGLLAQLKARGYAVREP